MLARMAMMKALYRKIATTEVCTDFSYNYKGG